MRYLHFTKIYVIEYYNIRIKNILAHLMTKNGTHICTKYIFIW